jgi:hypothetical protein
MDKFGVVADQVTPFYLVKVYFQMFILFRTYGHILGGYGKTNRKHPAKWKNQRNGPSAIRLFCI